MLLCLCSTGILIEADGEVDEIDKKEIPQLSEKEKQLLRLIREVGYGEIRIFVAEGQPVRAEEIRKSVKFN